MPIDMSYADARNLIEGHLNKDKPEDDAFIWVKDLFDDKVIYEDDGTLFQATYAITEGEVTLGTPERVKTTYETFAELKGVEVLRVGTFTSADGSQATFTEADLAEVLKNFKEIPNNKIPAVVGHADGDESELINAVTVGAPVIAYMSALREVIKAGVPTLVADFGDMAEKAIDMIGKTLVRISPEIFSDFKDNEGTAHGKAFRRISFIGRSAIRELPDVTEANLAFGDDSGQETMVLDLSEAPPGSEPKKGGTDEVSDITSHDDLVKLAETNPVIKEFLDKQKKLEEAAKAATTKLSEQGIAAHKEGIKTFLDKLGEDGRLSPAMRPSVEAFMESLSHGDDAAVIKFGESGKESEKDPLGFFKEVLLSKESVITFGETEPASNPDVVAGDVEALISKYQESHQDVTYAQAAVEVSRAHPELFK
jgi:hypothetical protein